MPLGDGTQWDEANPQQSTEANTIDSYERDLRIGVRSRMANEHVWPSSQTGTSQAGQHIFISMPVQTSTPVLPLGQSGLIFINTGSVLSFFDGTNVTQIAAPGPIVSNPYVKVSEVQSQNVSGGSATSGSWQTRVINTKDFDTANIANINSNQITLPPGIYRVSISVPFFNNIARFQTRLQNITANTTLLIGQGSDLESGNDTGSLSPIVGIITLTVSSALAVQYQVTRSVNTNDLGIACNFGAEVYTVAEFTKIG